MPAPRGRAGVGRQPTAGPGVVHPGRHFLPPWDSLPCLAPSSCRPPREGVGLFEAASLGTISLPALRDRQGLPANLGCRPQPFPLPGGQAFSRPSRRVEQWLALPASPPSISWTVAGPLRCAGLWVSLIPHQPVPRHLARPGKADAGLWQASNPLCSFSVVAGLMGPAHLCLFECIPLFLPAIVVDK